MVIPRTDCANPNCAQAATSVSTTLSCNGTGSMSLTLVCGDGVTTGFTPEQTDGDKFKVCFCDGSARGGCNSLSDFSSNGPVIFVPNTPPPTPAPTPAPTTTDPTPSPTRSPTASPTVSPTVSPTTSPTVSPTTKPTPSPTPAPTGEQGVRAPRFVALRPSVSTVFLTENRASAGTTLTRSEEVLLLPASGATTLYASWGPFQQQVQVGVPGKTAVHVRALLVDKEVDENTRRVRVACQAMDENFDTAGVLQTTRCFVRLETASSVFSASANCRPDAVMGQCTATFDQLNDQMLSNGNLTIRYGLNTETPSRLGEIVLAHPPLAAVDDSGLQNNYVLTVPSRSLFAGEVFTAKVTARATETVALGQFSIDIGDADGAVEFVLNSARELSSTTWTMSMTSLNSTTPMFVMLAVAPQSCTACPSCRPCHVAQPGGQADQQVLEVQLKVTADVEDANAALRLRVYEFGVGADLEVPPGGQVIRESAAGWVHGHVLGGVGDSTVNVNIPGALSIKTNSAVGMFAYLASGGGSLYNVAPITGNAITVVTSAVAYFPYSTLFRSVNPRCPAAVYEYATLGDDCAVTLTPGNTAGAADVLLTIGYGTIRATMRLDIFWASSVSVQTDATVLGALQLDESTQLQSVGCTGPSFASTRITATSTFTNSIATTAAFDVTHMLLHQLTTANASIATIDATAGTITGVAEGTTAVGFGADRTIDIQVNSSEIWQLQGLHTRTFSGLSVSSSASEGEVSIALELTESTLMRLGTEGRFRQVSWAEFASPSGVFMHHELSRSPSLTYSVGLPDVISVVNSSLSTLGYVEAQGNGNGAVFATWAPPCGASIIQAVSGIAVELQEADSIRITNGASNGALGTLQLAHSGDAAFVVGAVRSAAQRIVAVLVFPTYMEAAAEATFTVDNGELLSIGPCAEDQEHICVLPNPAVSGETTVHVTQGLLTAAVTVVIIQATGIEAAALAFPRFTDNSGNLAMIATLRPFGDAAVTFSFEQAQLLVLLVLSSGTTRDVSVDGSTSYELAAGSDVEVFDGRHLRVTDPATGNITSTNSIEVEVAGRNGDQTSVFIATVSLGIDRLPNVASTIENVQVVDQSGRAQSTLHGVADSTFQCTFVTTFADGFLLPSTGINGAQFASGFVTNLFGFFSDHTDEMPVDASGAVTILKNSFGTASVVVSSDSTNGRASGTTPGLWVNLQAGDLQIDVASSRERVTTGQPLADASTDDASVQLYLYLTSTRNSIAAIDIEFDFDASLLEFVSVEVGDDFGGILAGREDDGRPGMVALGGATINYVEGAERHIATINFRAVAGGVAAFEGRVSSYVNSDATELDLSLPVAFGEVGNVAMAIAGNGRRRLRRQGGSAVPMQRRQVGSCEPGSGPEYPTADANGDCAFSISDVLITLQFLLVSNDGDAAIAQFFTTRQSSGTVGNSRDQTAMDVDQNAAVRVSDAHLMLFVLFGHSRFVIGAASACASDSTIVTLEVTVEQASSMSSFSEDPSSAAQTRVFFVVTGAASGGNGRFSNIVPADDVDMATGVYSAELNTTSVPVPFGISVVVLVSVADQWQLGSFFAGNASAERTENAVGNLHASLTTCPTASDYSVYIKQQSPTTPEPTPSPTPAPATTDPTPAPIQAPPPGPTENALEVTGYQRMAGVAGGSCFTGGYAFIENQGNAGDTGGVRTLEFCAGLCNADAACAGFDRMDDGWHCRGNYAITGTPGAAVEFSWAQPFAPRLTEHCTKPTTPSQLPTVSPTVTPKASESSAREDTSAAKGLIAAIVGALMLMIVIVVVVVLRRKRQPPKEGAEKPGFDELSAAGASKLENISAGIAVVVPAKDAATSAGNRLGGTPSDSLIKRASMTTDKKNGLRFKSVYRSNPLTAAEGDDPAGEPSRISTLTMDPELVLPPRALTFTEEEGMLDTSEVSPSNELAPRLRRRSDSCGSALAEAEAAHPIALLGAKDLRAMPEMQDKTSRPWNFGIGRFSKRISRRSGKDLNTPTNINAPTKRLPMVPLELDNADLAMDTGYIAPGCAKPTGSMAAELDLPLPDDDADGPVDPERADIQQFLATDGAHANTVVKHGFGGKKAPTEDPDIDITMDPDAAQEGLKSSYILTVGAGDAASSAPSTVGGVAPAAGERALHDYADANANQSIGSIKSPHAPASVSKLTMPTFDVQDAGASPDRDVGKLTMPTFNVQVAGASPDRNVGKLTMPAVFGTADNLAEGGSRPDPVVRKLDMSKVSNMFNQGNSTPLRSPAALASVGKLNSSQSALEAKPGVAEQAHPASAVSNTGPRRSSLV